MSETIDAAFEVFDREPPLPTMSSEILAGLQASVKSIPPKYFYDAKGSRLFDAITELPEYYPTRTEVGILRRHASDYGALVDAESMVEYGSGSSTKVRILLESVMPSAYVPVDISKDHLVRAARAIQADFPGLDVYPTCDDYTQPFALPAPVAALSQVAFFPGSSVGNFSPAAADAFLANVARVVGPGGWFMIGADLKKDPDVLHAAYNDARGVTAAFNRNVLHHINQALGADFDPASFRHEALYNESDGRIEMYLVAESRQVVTIAGETVVIDESERLHTENSHKYGTTEFQDKMQRAGFETVEAWTDDQEYFLVLLARAVS